jgi:superfamily I DNA/RNA helicase
VVPEHHARRLRREAAERYLEGHQAVAVFLREKRLSASDLLEMYERKSKLNLQTRFLAGASEEILRHEAELVEIALAMATIYGQLKGQYQVFDFNDLLFQFMQALKACEDIRQLIQFQYPHIYVDEYQDTNRVQVSILKLLTTPESFLTVVGDDTQSIYSFQGSEVENIRNFTTDFDGAEVVVLNENYRSSPPIVAYVNALNATCQGALTKALVSRGPPCEVKPKRAIFITGQHR